MAMRSPYKSPFKSQGGVHLRGGLAASPSTTSPKPHRVSPAPGWSTRPSPQRVCARRSLFDGSSGGEDGAGCDVGAASCKQGGTPLGGRGAHYAVRTASGGAPEANSARSWYEAVAASAGEGQPQQAGPASLLASVAERAAGLLRRAGSGGLECGSPSTISVAARTAEALLEPAAPPSSVAAGGEPARTDEQARAAAAQKLVACLEHTKHEGAVQGTLSLLASELSAGSLPAADALHAGVVPRLAALIRPLLPAPASPPAHAPRTTLLALEAASALLAAQGLPRGAGPCLAALAEPAVRVLRSYSAAQRARAPASPTAASPSPLPPRSPLARPDAGSATAASEEALEHEGPALPAAFYAASVAARLACHPEAAGALVRCGAVAALAANLGPGLPPILPQVCVLALYKLLRVGSHADNLVDILQGPGIPGLVAALSVRTTASGASLAAHHEMAASILMDVALLPETPRHAADTNLAAGLVQCLGPAAPTPEARMYALLLLGRLAARSSAVQMDAAREGAVPLLAGLMAGGSEAEQLHAARVAAIIAQAVPTHQALQDSGVMAALLGLLRTGSPSVTEHAASVFAVMANNPATHFQVVGSGAVPLLVGLLQPDAYGRGWGYGTPGTAGTPPQAQAYALAALQLLAMHEPRHADVICRCGAVPLLVGLVEAGGTGDVREYAAAVLASLAHTVDVQEDIIAAGGVPALVRLLGLGSPGAQGHAAEVLVALAGVDEHRKRLIVRASPILPLLQRLLQSEVPVTRYWGAVLLNMLCKDDSVLMEVEDMEGMAEAVAALLLNQDPEQDTDARLAQVQAAWVVARLCESPEASAALAELGCARPLVAMMDAGMSSFYTGAGGAVHLPWAGAAQAAARGRRRPAPREALDANGHAAAVAALLALARGSGEGMDEVERALTFHEAWCGRRLELAGFNAPAMS